MLSPGWLRAWAGRTVVPRRWTLSARRHRGSTPERVGPSYLADQLCQPGDTEAQHRLRSTSSSSPAGYGPERVGPSYLADELCQPGDTEAQHRLRSTPLHRRRLSAVHGCQLSVTVLFRSPLLVSGTVFRSTSRHHCHWLSSAVTSRHLFRRCFPWL